MQPEGSNRIRNVLAGLTLGISASVGLNTAFFPSKIASADDSISATSRVTLDLPNQVKSNILKTSLALAQLGLKEQAEKLLGFYARVETSERSKSAAKKKIAEELSRAESRPLSERKALSLLNKSGELVTNIVSSLSSNLLEQPLEIRREIAEIIISLDSSNAVAGTVLGYKEQNGNWILAAEAQRDQINNEMAEYVSLAKALDFSSQIEVGTAENEILKSVCDRKSSYAKYKDKAGGIFELWSCDLSPEDLLTTAQDVLRSLALANRMLGGGYETNLRQRAAYVFFDKKADRLKAMQQAQEGNYLSFSSEALLTTFTESNFHWDKRGYTVFQNRVDSIPSVILTDIDSAVLGNDAYSSPQIIIGLLNSASTNVSGMPLPGLISFEKGSGGNESSHTSAHVDERKLEYFLRLASSNAYGGKLCARFLDYHGLLPHWSDSFLPNATQIGGFNRLKSTLMCEFIAGQGKLGELFRETRALTPGDKQSFKETIKTVLGYDYDELERRFRTWLGPLKPEATGGILQQLTSLNIGGQGKELKVATPAELALQILEPIRARALDPKDILPIFVDEELSEGATAHARYLTLNPDEYRYPEVHTEKSTLPGFTKEGRMRAASSVISGGGDNMEQVINGFMRTFYHRLPLITPNVFAINAGVHEKNTLIDCSTGVMAVQPVTPYVCWPPSNEKNVPTTAYAEVPAPLPGHDMSLMGFPISVVVNNPEVDLKNVEIKLYKGDPKDGVLVDCHFISPFNNPQPLVELTNEFGLIPKVPLQTSTEYTTVVAEGSRVLIQNSFITERTRSK